MKRLYFSIFILIFILSLSLAACYDVSEDQVEFQSEYCSYYDTSYDSYLNLPSNIKYCIHYVAKSPGYNPNVVVAINAGSTSAMYNWLNLSSNDRKKDLKSIGDKYVDFSNYMEWDNKYHLYIVLSLYKKCDIQIVYDYDSDTLFIPTYEDVYKDMYTAFGSFRSCDLEDNNEGISWLVDKGFGTMLHGQYEPDHFAYDADFFYIFLGSGKYRGKLNGADDLYDTSLYDRY